MFFVCPELDLTCVYLSQRRPDMFTIGLIMLGPSLFKHFFDQHSCVLRNPNQTLSDVIHCDTSLTSGFTNKQPKHFSHKNLITIVCQIEQHSSCCKSVYILVFGSQVSVCYSSPIIQICYFPFIF